MKYKNILSEEDFQKHSEISKSFEEKTNPLLSELTNKSLEIQQLSEKLNNLLSTEDLQQLKRDLEQLNNEFIKILYDYQQLSHDYHILYDYIQSAINDYKQGNLSEFQKYIENVNQKLNNFN